MKYRDALPQLNGHQMVADGGLETALVFLEGFDLPLFAAFKALESERGIAAIDRYMRGFAEIATKTGRGFVMDTPTWRASARWAEELGISRSELREIHRGAVATLVALRNELETPRSPFVINGAIGPQDDGYSPTMKLSVGEAKRYHADQVGWFAEMGADMVTAVTMTYTDEALGIVHAANAVRIPVAVSFTVETDGRLPSGQALGDAISEVDAATDSGTAYFMINCAHPDHFSNVLDGRDWTRRIRGIRANASRMSHAELDNAEELDAGDPVELAALYRALGDKLPNLSVMGGCCGTDHRHIAHIAGAA